MNTSRSYRCLDRQEVISDQYSLRTIQDEDIEDIRNWRNSQVDVLRQDNPISHEQQKTYFDQNIWPAMELENPKNILLTLFKDQKRIGYGGLVHISWKDLRAEVSFLLNPKLTKDKESYQIHFSNYLSLVKSVAFSVINLNRLHTETYAFRRDHIATLEFCNFQLEGRMREHVMINQKYFDSLIHGVINEK